MTIYDVLKDAVGRTILAGTNLTFNSTPHEVIRTMIGRRIRISSRDGKNHQFADVVDVDLSTSRAFQRFR